MFKYTADDEEFPPSIASVIGIIAAALGGLVVIGGVAWLAFMSKS